MHCELCIVNCELCIVNCELLRGDSLQILGERRVAVLITVVIAVAATLIGVNRGLKRAMRNIEDAFYNGVYLEDQKYTEPSINSHIQNCAENALNLATLLQGHPELKPNVDALLSARRDLLNAKDLAAKSAADRRMFEMFANLEVASQTVELTDRESEVIDLYLNSFFGARSSMAHSAFHDKTLQYSKEVSFIARLFSVVLPNKPPKSNYFS